MANYENKKSFNNVASKDGEVLVPIHALELLKWNKESIEKGYVKPGELIDEENLETWHLGGRKILVGFTPVPKENEESAIKSFWYDVNDYIESTRKKRCLIANKKGELIRCPKCNKCQDCDNQGNPNNITSRFLSLDKFIEDNAIEGERGWDPTGTFTYEDSSSTLSMIAELIDEVAKLDANYGEILKLLAKDFKKRDIIKIIDLQRGQTQSYALIDKIQLLAKEIYEENYC